MRVAVLGGSFNPPHMSHLFLAMSALASEMVEHVLVVPCLEHAFRKGLAPFPHRLAMTKLAFSPLGPKVSVSDIEVGLGVPSRTYNTLSCLLKENPLWQLRLLLGGDIPLEREKWFRIDDVEAMAPPLVFGRLGTGQAEGLLLPDISSTEIRRRIRNGVPLMNLVPASVAAYVERHGLYIDSQE